MEMTVKINPSVFSSGKATLRAMMGIASVLFGYICSSSIHAKICSSFESVNMECMHFVCVIVRLCI